MRHDSVTSARSFDHRAFVYESLGEFVGTMAPVVRSGLDRDDLVLVVTSEANADGLSEELGADASRVEFRLASDWYANPASTLDAYRRRIDESAAGGCATIVGEPVWRGSPAAMREWSRYESVINAAFVGTRVDLVCPYDASALPDDVLTQALDTHPVILSPAGFSAPSSTFVAPASFVRSHSALPPLEEVAEMALHDTRSLRALRELVDRRARSFGVDALHAPDLVLAASEVGANALRHGLPPAIARLGVMDGDFVCEVSDAGPGPADALVGWTPPASGHCGGWGLAMARRLADAVEISANGERCLVRLHFDLAIRS